MPLYPSGHGPSWVSLPGRAVMRPELTAFEQTSLINLQPPDVEQARALIPSLSVRASLLPIDHPT